jgi:hypothetical protein
MFFYTVNTVYGETASNKYHFFLGDKIKKIVCGSKMICRSDYEKQFYT